MNCLLFGREHVRSGIVDESLLGEGGLGISSLALLQAFVKVEEKFQFKFNDTMVATTQFRTVGDFVEFVSRVIDAEEKVREIPR